MSKHAKLAPSAAHRWMQCPGSIRLTADLPGTDSEYAREGTFAHDIAALVLADDSTKAADLIGQTDGEFTLDIEMARHIDAYVDAVRGVRFLAGEGAMLIEQKVVLDEHVYGTADALVWSDDGTELHVIDLKFGAGVLVGVVENVQLLIYALGAVNTFRDRCAALETVTLHVYQPRRLDDEDNAHREWTLTLEELDRWFDRVNGAVRQTEKRNAPLVPGDHCKFCPAAGTCPGLREAALSRAVDVFPEGDPTTPIEPPDPSTFTVEDLARILDAADIVETWIKAVRANAKERAMQGTPVPGYKIVQKLGNRRWAKPEEEIAMHLQSAGVDPYAEPKLISPAQAEKLGKSRIKPLVAELVERPLGAFELVPDSHKLPAISETRSDVFDDLTG